MTAAVGAAVVYFTSAKELLLVPFGIGLGIIAYAGAVAFFTLLAVLRMRRADRRCSLAAPLGANVTLPLYARETIQPQGK